MEVGTAWNHPQETGVSRSLISPLAAAFNFSTAITNSRSCDGKTRIVRGRDRYFGKSEFSAAGVTKPGLRHRMSFKIDDLATVY